MERLTVKCAREDCRNADRSERSCLLCRPEYPSVGLIDFVGDDRLLQEMRTTEIDEFAGNNESQVVGPDVRLCRAQRWMPQQGDEIPVAAFDADIPDGPRCIN